MFLLSEIESPFVTGNPPDFIDVVTATAVCAKPWAPERTKRITLIERIAFRLWAWSIKKCNIVHEAANLRDHLKSSIKSRPVKRLQGEPSEGAPSGVHERLYAFLTKHLNQSHETALRFPVRDAVKQWEIEAASSGGVEFYSDFELSVMEEVKRRDQEAIKAGRLNPDGTRREHA